MVWFRVDDGLPQSIKILSIPRAERAAAVGLWTLAGAWAAGELTDGFVPDFVIADLPAGDTHSEYLITAKLWSKVTHPVTQEPGIQFHDWSDYQPARVDVLDVRARHAANQRAYRERKREEWKARNGDQSPADNNIRSDAAPTQTRPRPDPDRSSYGTTRGVRANARKRATPTPSSAESTGTRRLREIQAALDTLNHAEENGQKPRIETGT